MPIKIRKTLLHEPITFDTIGNHWDQVPIYRPNGYPLYHYLQTEKGVGKIEIQGKSYLLNENEGILIAPFIPHSYAKKTDEWFTMFITFTGTMESSLSQALGNKQIIFIPKEQGIIIAKELFDMISQYENPSTDAKYFSLASYHLLMNFIDNSAFNLLNEPLYQKYVLPVIKEIETSYASEITVQKLSQQVYVTPQYLSRLFSKFLGCSVYKYLTNYRINKAKELLLTHQRMEIQQISQLVGFLDTSHFIAMFKKFTGITPLDFTQTQLKKLRLMVLSSLILALFLLFTCICHAVCQTFFYQNIF